MIFGIGTDIVSVPRIERGLERYGERFARRILTDDEYEGFMQAGRQANFLAKRFAAKEAAAKALGLGFSNGLSLHHIAVVNDPLGRPLLQFFGRGLEILEEFGIGESFLSLADERDTAIAFVTLTRKM